DAGTRMQAMVDAAPTVPRKIFRGVPAMPGGARQPGGDRPADDAPAVPTLQAAISACRACPLWQPATQAVPGEGPADARIMVVGEQPGDHEDLLGRPFVGPAGRLLDRALAEAGLARDTLYLTNAVKHFKFKPAGKRRLHVRADAA